MIPTNLKHGIWRVALAGLVMGVAGIGSSGAGELNVENGQPVWSSTLCIRPAAPQVDKADAQALNASIVRYNRYVTAVDQYNRCLRDEADGDLRSLRESINDGVRTLQAAAIADADGVQEAINAPRGPEEPATETIP